MEIDTPFDYGDMTEFEVEASVTLPFSLKIAGSSKLVVDGYSVDLEINTNRVESTRYPGLEQADNVYMDHDETNFFEETTLKMRYECLLPVEEVQCHMYTLNESPKQILGFVNRVVLLSRTILGDVILPPAIEAWQLGSIGFRYKKEEQWKEGFFNSLNGLKNFREPFPEAKLKLFNYFMASGEGVPLSHQILADAKRYMIKKDSRMATLNMCLYFEVGIKEILQSFSFILDEEYPDSSWEAWPLNKSATLGLKQTLGAGLNSSNYWGERARNTFEKVIPLRNSIMHKGVIESDVFNGRSPSEEAINKLYNEIEELLVKVRSESLKRLEGLLDLNGQTNN